MELLTDAVGRPAYGRIDPTVFMLISYPLFFGMMLGDMAYGLATIALGSFLIMRSGTNEMVMLGGSSDLHWIGNPSIRIHLRRVCRLRVPAPYRDEIRY